ncbi:MAG: Stf0 family sulfotransferase [Alphaproteobacteria bacterium]
MALTYFICSTPRSGSSLLSELMRQTGRLGNAQEYLNKDVQLPRYARDWGLVKPGGQLDLGAYLRAVRSNSATANGVCGVKAHYSQFAMFKTLTPVKALFEEARLIWIRREDVVAQAVSFYLALATKQWSSLDPARAKAPDFDAAKIQERIDNLETQNAAWSALFRDTGREPLTVSYEALLEDPEAIRTQLSSFLDLEIPVFPDLRTVALKQQATALNRDYVERFKRLQAEKKGLRGAA